MKSINKNKTILVTFIASFLLSSFASLNFNLSQLQMSGDMEPAIKDKLKSAGEFDWEANITRSVGNSPYGLFVGDANNDGQDDIVTANFAGNNVTILCWDPILNDWTAPINKSVGDGPYSVFIADANNDGQNDIITANSISNDVSVLCWNITSTDWDELIPLSVGTNPYSVFVADANNDGENDIVTANE